MPTTGSGAISLAEDDGSAANRFLTLVERGGTLINGSASNASNRYGDYSSLNVDPVDGCTYWFTGEYNQTGFWSTRIGTVRFDGCPLAFFSDGFESGDVSAWSNSIGDTELLAVWVDPDFDPAHRAFYYLRVLEIPTPRWTAYDAKYYGLKDLSKDITMKSQQRAYTSPIWYSPK